MLTDQSVDLSDIATIIITHQDGFKFPTMTLQPSFFTDCCLMLLAFECEPLVKVFEFCFAQPVIKTCTLCPPPETTKKEQIGWYRAEDLKPFNNLLKAKHKLCLSGAKLAETLSHSVLSYLFSDPLMTRIKLQLWHLHVCVCCLCNHGKAKEIPTNIFIINQAVLENTNKQKKAWNSPEIPTVYYSLTMGPRFGFSCNKQKEQSIIFAIRCEASLHSMNYAMAFITNINGLSKKK